MVLPAIYLLFGSAATKAEVKEGEESAVEADPRRVPTADSMPELVQAHA